MGVESNNKTSSPEAQNNGDTLSREDFAAILDGMQETFYRTDKDGLLVYISRSVKRLLGYEPAELLGSRLSDLYVEADGREKFLVALKESNGNIETYEAPLVHKDGHVVWVSTNAHYYRNSDGEPTGVEGTSRDVTEAVMQQQELKRLKNTLDKTLDCVFMFEPDTLKFFYLNEGALKQVGYSREELLQMTPVDIKPDYDEIQFRSLLQPLLDGSRNSLTFETVHRHKNGNDLPVEIFLQYIKSDNELPRYVAIVRDLSERVEAQEKLLYQANHDFVTGLPNRFLLMDRLDHALSRRKDKGMLALLFIDLDRFKVINDTLGHVSGDKALLMLGQRMSACLRKGDTLARISGDEFSVIVEDVESSDVVVKVAKHILDALEKPFVIDGNELFITASIGISMWPNDGEDSQNLLKHADIAMYRAKDLGRNTYQFYSPEMSSKAFERLSLETSLRYALEREQFELYYQPQVNVLTGKAIGMEALLRWNHPDLGVVSPVDFISILEDTGLIVPVGEWVLYAACIQAKAWQDRYDAALRMSVNLSARQFKDAGLASTVEYCLQRTGLPASSLELEITESIIMQDKSSIRNIIQDLNDLGVRLAIDDFGTGYSSLSYLKRFPIDTIKIDKSFVRDIATNEDDAAIVSAIIAMAASLKLDVVAEGVETDQQLSLTKRKECAVMQGFLFSEPVKAKKLDVMLSESSQCWKY